MCRFLFLFGIISSLLISCNKVIDYVNHRAEQALNNKSTNPIDIKGNNLDQPEPQQEKEAPKAPSDLPVKELNEEVPKAPSDLPVKAATDLPVKELNEGIPKEPTNLPIKELKEGITDLPVKELKEGITDLPVKELKEEIPKEPTDLPVKELGLDPTALEFKIIANIDKIQLTWKNPNLLLTTYRPEVNLYKNTTEGEPFLLLREGLLTQEYMDDRLIPGVSYEYKLEILHQTDANKNQTLLLTYSAPPLANQPCKKLYYYRKNAIPPFWLKLQYTGSKYFERAFKTYDTWDLNWDNSLLFGEWPMISAGSSYSSALGPTYNINTAQNVCNKIVEIGFKDSSVNTYQFLEGDGPREIITGIQGNPYPPTPLVDFRTMPGMTNLTFTQTQLDQIFQQAPSNDPYDRSPYKKNPLTPKDLISLSIHPGDNYGILLVSTLFFSQLRNGFLEYYLRQGVWRIPNLFFSKGVFDYLLLFAQPPLTTTDTFFSLSDSFSSRKLGGTDDLGFGYAVLRSPGTLEFGASLHELAHAWGNGGQLPTENIPNYSAHWGISTVDGQLGGFALDALEEVVPDGVTLPQYAKKSIVKTASTPTDSGKSTFRLQPGTSWSPTTGNNTSPGRYGEFELYLMGLLTEAEAKNQFVLTFTNVTWYTDGYFTATPTKIPFESVKQNPLYTPKAYYDLVANEPRTFRTLLLYVTYNPYVSKGYLQTIQESVERFGKEGPNRDANGLNMPAYNFWEATKGRAKLVFSGLKDPKILLGTPN